MSILRIQKYNSILQAWQQFSHFTPLCMKIIVIGAAGYVGARICEHGLQAGHAMTAFDIQPARLARENELLTVIRGDILESNDLAEHLRGASAVISCLNLPKGGPPDLILKATRNIMDGMRAQNVNRLIVIGGTGMLKTPAGKLVMDDPGYPQDLRAKSEFHLQSCDLLRESALDWTYICAPYIPGSAGEGQYRVQPDMALEGGNSIHMGDLCAFVFKELQQSAFSKSVVAIAN